jgi:formylglycine-generating enzyme required for sulfatase activity
LAAAVAALAASALAQELTTMAHLVAIASLLLLPLTSAAAVVPDASLLPPTLPPLLLPDPSSYASWASSASASRNATLAALGLNFSSPAASAYAVPSLAWTFSSAVLLAHVPLYDRRLFSPSPPTFSAWTPQAYLADLQAQLGGSSSSSDGARTIPDAVVLWPAAQALGLDGRAQLDLLASLPGGLPALAAVVAGFHAASVRVLLAYFPWDTGLGPPSASAAFNATLASVLFNASFDGAYLAGGSPAASCPLDLFVVNSTSGKAPTYFALAADGALPSAEAWVPANGTGTHPLLRQPLSRLLPADAGRSAAPPSPPAPAQTLVSAYRWLERRHVAFRGADFARGDLAFDALSALVDGGGGLSVMDNAFGIANRVTQRDGQLIARVAALLRFLIPLARAGPAVAAGAGPEDGGDGGDGSGGSGGGATTAPLPTPPSSPLPDGLRALSWLPLFPVTDVDPSAPAAAVSAAQLVGPCPDPAAGSQPCAAFLFANTAPAGTPGGDAGTVTVNITLAYGLLNTTVGTYVLYDLYRGVPVNSTPSAGSPANVTAGGALLSVSVEAGGLAAILASPVAAGPYPGGGVLSTFLAQMANLTAVPLRNFSSAWSPLPQAWTPVPPVPGTGSSPPGMTFLPGMTGYRFVAGPVLGAYPFAVRPDAAAAALEDGTDVQYPWEATPSSPAHAATFDVFPYFLDTAPATNEDFAQFVAATGYNGSAAGVDPANFLRHWVLYPNGTFSYNASNGDGPRPVVWVSRSDAGAYCGWRGKRLPTEWELQFAGQATAAGGGAGTTDYRQFPWGNATCDAKPGACPDADAGPVPRDPDPVLSHPLGASALGVQDLVGLVWHLTDEYCDEMTCAVVLRGGSFFRPVAGPGGGYAPSGPAALSLTAHLRLPVLDDSGHRGALVGFRCALDSAEGEGEGEGGGGGGGGRWGSFRLST